jgi:hypothetical protein
LSQDDQYDFEGHHCLLQKGYGTVLQKLADGLDVRYNHPVQALHYNDDNVKVTTSNGETFEGDIVLVTLPLGVLKQGTVDFEPPLPGWKVDVINRMGFGNLNKIGLQFPSVFWDDTKDYFGVCDDEIEQRYCLPPYLCTRGDVFRLLVGSPGPHQGRVLHLQQHAPLHEQTDPAGSCSRWCGVYARGKE